MAVELDSPGTLGFTGYRLGLIGLGIVPAKPLVGFI